MNRDNFGRFTKKQKESVEIPYSLLPWILLVSILIVVILIGNLIPNLKQYEYNKGFDAGLQNLSQEKDKSFHDGFSKGNEFAGWVECPSQTRWSSKLMCNGTSERLVDEHYNIKMEWNSSGFFKDNGSL